MFNFSNFKEIIDCVDKLASNFTSEISDAQRLKLRKLCDTAFDNIQTIKYN